MTAPLLPAHFTHNAFDVLAALLRIYLHAQIINPEQGPCELSGFAPDSPQTPPSAVNIAPRWSGKVCRIADKRSNPGRSGIGIDWPTFAQGLAVLTKFGPTHGPDSARRRPNCGQLRANVDRTSGQSGCRWWLNICSEWLVWLRISSATETVNQGYGRAAR